MNLNRPGIYNFRWHHFPLAFVVFLMCVSSVWADTPKPTLRLQSPAINSLLVQLPIASIEFYQQGDIKLKISEKFVDPTAARHTVEFETEVGANLPVKRILWQVSANPFVGALDAPSGLILSGISDQRVFQIDFAEVARKLGLSNAPRPGSGQIPNPVRAVQGQVQLQTQNKQLSNPASAQTTPRITRGNLAAAVQKEAPDRIFYVRTLPIDPKVSNSASPRILGRPSASLRVVWGKPPVPTVPNPDMSAFDAISTELFNLELVSLEFVPHVVKENWPAGCTPIPRDDGKFTAEDAWDALASAPGWVSTAYQDAKNAVISVVAFLLPFVPESVISFALDAALASAGIPPSLPNLDQMIDGGADYLATQMAAQIPIPASGLLAEMAYEEARSEIQKQSKKALVDLAHDMKRKLEEESEYCRTYYADPFFKVTVRNASVEALEQVSLSLFSSGDLLETITLPIDRIEAGQQFTLPIAYLQWPNVKVRHHTQLPGKDLEKARMEWWQAITTTPLEFRLHLPVRRDCYADGSCGGESRVAVKTPRRIWYNGPAWSVKQP